MPEDFHSNKKGAAQFRSLQSNMKCGEGAESVTIIIVKNRERETHADCKLPEGVVARLTWG